MVARFVPTCQPAVLCESAEVRPFREVENKSAIATCTRLGIGVQLRTMNGAHHMSETKKCPECDGGGCDACQHTGDMLCASCEDEAATAGGLCATCDANSEVAQ